MDCDEDIVVFQDHYRDMSMVVRMSSLHITH